MVLHHALVLFRMTYQSVDSHRDHSFKGLPFENFVVGWFLSKAAETAFQSPVDIRSLVSKKMIRSCPVAE
jgi:hypothetical protein